jgi:hypothetical protein
MLPVSCSQVSPPSRFTYGGGGSTVIADSLNLKPVARPAFILPKGINAQAEQELKLLITTVRGYTSFSEELFNQNPNDEFGETCESAIRTCDFTLGGETDGLEIAFSLEWQCLTQCDMGSFTILYRTVKKSKPAVLLDCGCGENSGCEKEATEKQMKAMLKRLGLKKASAVELLAVLLLLAGPDFLKTYQDFEAYDMESWGGDETKLFEAAGNLLKADNEEEEEEGTKPQVQEKVGEKRKKGGGGEE